jgi:hypothetical protein
VANSKPSFVPPIDPSLLAHVHTPDDWLLETAPRSIDHFNRVLDSIPRNYSWEFMSVEAFRRIGSTLDTPAAAYAANGDATESDEAGARGERWRPILGKVQLGDVIEVGAVVSLADVSRDVISLQGCCWIPKRAF